MIAIPTAIDGQNSIFIMDPGLIIPTILKFDLGSGTYIQQYSNRGCSIEYNGGNNIFPYSLILHSLDSEGVSIRRFTVPFNPLLVIKNPDTIVTKDIMRGFLGCSYIKHDQEGKKVAMLDLSLKRRIVRVRMPGISEVTIEFDTLKMNPSAELVELLQAAIDTIGKGGLEIEDILQVIKHEELIKQRLFAPSVRENI